MEGITLDTGLLKLLESGGSLLILGLIVFKFPSIMTQIDGMIQRSVENMHKAHQETLATFDKQMTSMIENFNRRFENIEKILQRESDLKDRIERLERSGEHASLPPK